MCNRILLAVFAGLLLPAAAHTQEVRPPNIVVILADDLGWTDVGCQGTKYYETPNIDRLAAEGLRLTSFYHSQNCAPTRAALMSGQYAPRTGVYTVGSLERGAAKDRKMTVPMNETRLPLDRVTIAGTLKEAGYATAIYGKWHLGEKGEYHPSRRGFDEAIISMGKHFNFTTNPKVAVPPDAYLADFLTGRAEKFIDQNKQRPFFLFLSHFGVHTPLEAKKGQFIEKYRKKPAVGDHKDPVYAAMIESIDQSVGRILKKLDDLKLAGDTIVIFASDNGGVGGYLLAGVRARSITGNSPLRGGKGMLYEGGLRVFIVRWPGQIPPGRTSDVPCAHVDLLPTFVEAAGKKTLPRQPLDGVSLVKLWKNPQISIDRDIFFHFPGYLEGDPGYWRTTPCGMMRSGDFTLLEFFEDGRLELYNVKNDLGQKVNLAEKLPERTRELHQRVIAWRQTIGAHMPKLK